MMQITANVTDTRTVPLIVKEDGGITAALVQFSTVRTQPRGYQAVALLQQQTGTFNGVA